jgi:hypothetical protein
VLSEIEDRIKGKKYEMAAYKEMDMETERGRVRTRQR